MKPPKIICSICKKKMSKGNKSVVKKEPQQKNVNNNMLIYISFKPEDLIVFI